MGMVTEWHALPPAEAAQVVQLDEETFVDWLEARTDEDDTSGDVLDLDKQWHVVHAVLTGTAWDTDGPCGRAVLGGSEFGNDLGYGPARFLAAAEVAEVADELDNVAAAGFDEAIDAEVLAELDVYPSGIPWDEPEERRYLVESCEELRAFYRRAATAGHAMVILIS